MAVISLEAAFLDRAHSSATHGHTSLGWATTRGAGGSAVSGCARIATYGTQQGLDHLGVNISHGLGAQAAEGTDHVGIKRPERLQSRHDKGHVSNACDLRNLINQLAVGGG